MLPLVYFDRLFGRARFASWIRLASWNAPLFNRDLLLLQIRDQVPDAICVGDVDENDFGSIRGRRRELDAADADKSGEAMLGYIDASNIFHANFVAALTTSPVFISTLRFVTI